MSKRLKKLISLGISMTFVIGATGCGKAKEDKNAVNKQAEKPSKITWATNSGLGEVDGREEFKAEFKKLTGVELDIFAPQSDYYDKLDTSISSGTAPDVIFLPDNFSKYASMKTLLDLDKYIENSDAAKKIKKESFDPIKLNGKIYGIPTEVNDGTVTYVRKDWLDKLGLKVPTNYTEFYNMLKAFKTIKAPNGASTIPLTAYMPRKTQWLPEFYQGANPDFIKKDGKWVDGFTEPEMKAALQRLADAYKDGLIDPEIFTNQTAQCRDKVYAGRVGAYTYWAGFWADTLEQNIKNGPAGKDASLVPIKAIEGVKYVGRTPTVNAISATAKNPDGIWNTFFETLLDGKDGSKLFSSGVEGVHYKTENNKIVGLPTKSNPKANYQKAYYPSYSLSVPVNFTVDYPAKVSESKDILNQSIQIPSLMPVSSARNKKDGDITNLKDTLIAKVIKGELTPDKAISDYKSKMEENNIPKILEELNK